MEATDRTEIREMIIGVLSGWHSETVLREITTNKSLDKIEKHLEQLNGKVASHEREIGELKIAGVQHIVDCPAMPKIDEVKNDVQTVKDDLQEYRLFKKYPKAGITVLFIALVLVGFNVFDLVKRVKIVPETKTEIQNQKTLEDKLNSVISIMDSLKVSSHR